MKGEGKVEDEEVKKGEWRESGGRGEERERYKGEMEGRNGEDLRSLYKRM